VNGFDPHGGPPDILRHWQRFPACSASFPADARYREQVQLTL
jgi:hypothetical protein